MFIRNYSREAIILEDEYQEVLKMQFEEEAELIDLAERVDVIKRTSSVADRLGSEVGRVQGSFVSMSAMNMARTASQNESFSNLYKSMDNARKNKAGSIPK